MIKRTQMLGVVLAATMTAGIGGVAHAAGNMTPEETAAELQQALSLDADITQRIEATVRDGKIVLTGLVTDQQAIDRLNQIIDEMDVEDGMIDNQVMKD